MTTRESYIQKQASASQRPLQEVARLMDVREAGFEVGLRSFFQVPEQDIPHAKQAYAGQLHRQMQNVAELAQIAQACLTK